MLFNPVEFPQLESVKVDTFEPVGYLLFDSFDQLGQGVVTSSMAATDEPYGFTLRVDEEIRN